MSLAWLAATHDDARPGDKTPALKPSDSMIIGIAQKFVLVHFAREPEGESHVAFDIASIYPREGGGYWAVVGGFMANPGSENPSPHAYGMAMSLTCSEHEKLDCWRLEKLVIDKKVILDK